MVELKKPSTEDKYSRVDDRCVRLYIYVCVRVRVSSVFYIEYRARAVREIRFEDQHRNIFSPDGINLHNLLPPLHQPISPPPF